MVRKNKEWIYCSVFMLTYIYIFTGMASTTPQTHVEPGDGMNYFNLLLLKCCDSLSSACLRCYTLPLRPGIVLISIYIDNAPCGYILCL